MNPCAQMLAGLPVEEQILCSKAVFRLEEACDLRSEWEAMNGSCPYRLTVIERHQGQNGKSLVVFLAALSLFAAAVNANPYLRVGLFVEERSPGKEEDPDTFSYASSIKPSQGKALRLYADSNSAASLLIVIIDRSTRDLSKQWLPQIWNKKDAFSAIRYPEAKRGICYEKDVPIDIFVVHFKEGSKDAAELSAHVKKLRSLDPETDSQRWLLHAVFVRDQVAQWFRRQNQEKSVAQYRSPAKAATQRAGTGIPILWREGRLVHKFPIPASQRPFVARFPVDHEHTTKADR